MFCYFITRYEEKFDKKKRRNLIAKVNSGIQIINMELTSTKEKLEFNYSNDYNNKIDDAYYKRKE